MSNVLDNGTVLPSGLLSGNSVSIMDAFKKTYQNYALRVGIVTKAYSIQDADNVRKRFAEYDVMVFEQNEDQGSAPRTYNHCQFMSSFGSIADFLEMNLRDMVKKTTRGSTPSPSGQNGAIVLLLCLNGLSDTGIIIGSLGHPDRPTTLTDGQPHLEGEYNGVHVVIDSDGSATFTVKGATDNDGKVISSNGTVSVSVDANKNLSVSVSGNVTINVTGNVNVNATDATVTATGTATVEGQTVKLGAGATDAVIKGDTFSKLYNNHMHLGNLGAPTGPPLSPMDPSLSKKVKTE